jgi:RND superfamily putative drug exporter
MERLKTQAWVESVASPYDEMTDYLVSDDQQAAVISVVFNFTMFTEDPLEDQAKDGLVEMSDQLQTELPGDTQVSVGGSLYSIAFPELTIFELVGVIVAFLVLLLMFGTITASVIPIVSSIVALALSMVVVFSMTSVENINSVTPMLALMLGLAVGIDYALFIMSKLVQHLKQGVVLDKAIMYAVSTAGGAVTFAGATVIIALLGLSLAFIPFLTIMGVLAGIGVLFAVISSVTFLPAVLGLVGDRILSKKYRTQYRTLAEAGQLKEFDDVNSEEDIAESKTPAARIYQRWFKIITRYPLVTVILIVLLLGGLSIPAKDLRLTIPEAQSLPEDNRAKITADLI